MCSTNRTPSSSSSSSMAKKTQTRKTRSRTRKPKFLSLRLQLSLPEKTHETHPTTDRVGSPTTDRDPGKGKEATHEENMEEIFFSAADGGAATMTSLFGPETPSSSSASLSFSGYGGRAASVSLVRSALRNRQREAREEEDEEEEKWVCYSEVVEERRDEEVTSCAAGVRRDGAAAAAARRSLSLKLDYEEIAKAWSDKGPLYVKGDDESHQIVPDVSDDFLTSDATCHGMRDGWGSNAGIFVVPEMQINGGFMEEKTKAEHESCWKAAGHREASVLRYREKRLNRLFSKKIRYEVRKINAEKRPRVKGRFVKRNEEEE